jgi:hypothetical protein
MKQEKVPTFVLEDGDAKLVLQVFLTELVLAVLTFRTELVFTVLMFLTELALTVLLFLTELVFIEIASG